LLRRRWLMGVRLRRVTRVHLGLGWIQGNCLLLNASAL
jgi:hypothetical protein